jgi:hypothetical protein
VQGNGAALGKTGEYDIPAFNACLTLPGDERFNHPLRIMNSLAVFVLLDLRRAYVVPGPHRHAAVDGDRLYRSMRENELYGFIRYTKLWYQGLEIMAIGTKSM